LAATFAILMRRGRFRLDAVLTQFLLPICL
jgi:hypothetical protein